MINLYFLLGFIAYCIGAYISNSAEIKLSQYYQLYGIIIGVIANFFWFTIAKTTTDSGKVLTYGLYWDMLLVVAFVSIPFIFFNIELSTTKWIGLTFMLFGFIVTKL